MTTRARNHSLSPTPARGFRAAPMASAIAVMLAAGGMGPAQAQRAFSGAWFAAKGTVQSQAAQTGRLPNGLPASSLAVLQQQRAGEQTARSLGNLNLAARQIAAQQAAQAAARQAALGASSDIPDGLADGGLKVDTNSLTAGWVNAGSPVQTASGSGTQVSIEQTAEKAILNWESFHVGKNTTVQFNQKGGNRADGSNNWIAFNRINDPSGVPSKIAGQIRSDGAVYLVNRNGIVFSGSSQVDTRSLVASSLRLTDEQFKAGINTRLRYPGDELYLADIPIPQFGEYSKQLILATDSKSFVPGEAPGAVSVQAGARIAVAPGGKALLFAPKVLNAGDISAPDGQVILAAGENVFLAVPKAGSPNAVRGLDIAVAAPAPRAFQYPNLVNLFSGAGGPVMQILRDDILGVMDARAAAVGYEVANTGSVSAERGNITLQSLHVTQSGILSASTALNNRNGSILLRAWGQGTNASEYDYIEPRSWSSGTLTLAPGSVTQVLPDAADRSEIELAALALRYTPGRVTLYGKLVDVQPKAGVLVPAGVIDVQSAANAFAIQGTQDLGSDASRIYLASDAFLSVAGLQDVQVAMARNFIEAELRANELRDSPLLRNSWLRGQKVTVDRRETGVFGEGPMAGVAWMDGQPGAWAGTPLADMSGWLGVGKTDLQEVSTKAGSILLQTKGGELVTRAGSVLDISGGSVRYGSGMNTATRLLGANGLIYTMDRAMPDMAYDSIAGRYAVQHARWGVTETFRSPLLGAGRMENGYTEGRAAGSIQANARKAIVLDGDILAGVVTGDRQNAGPAKPGGTLSVGGSANADTGWSPGRIIVSAAPLRLPDGFDAASAIDERWYDPQRADTGDGGTSFVKHTYFSDAQLGSAGLGRIQLYATDNVAIDKSAVLDLSPGAAFSINAVELSNIDIALDGTLRAAGGFVGFETRGGVLKLGAASRLDLSGQWINAVLDGHQAMPWAINGGTAALLQLTAAGGKLAIEAGAAIDVSGGGRADFANRGRLRLRVGDAGGLQLGGIDAGTALAGLDMRAYAAGAGASLQLTSLGDVQIGGAAQADAASLWLPGSLYGERGFSSLAVAAPGKSITVPEGAMLDQRTAYVDLPGSAWQPLSSGTAIADAAPPVFLRPEQLSGRAASVLSLTARDVTVGAGAQVRAATGGQVRLEASNDVVVLGTVEARGGRIDIQGSHDARLMAGARLDASGASLVYRDARGLRTGDVLPGGAVTIGATTGSLLLESGSAIDVSGALDTTDLPGSFGAVFSTAQASNGGSITLNAGRTGAVVGSSMNSRGGSAEARGGLLRIAEASGGASGKLLSTLVPTSLYWVDAGGVVRTGTLAATDLDILDEFGTAPIRLTAGVRSILNSLPGALVQGTEIMEGELGAADGDMRLSLAAFDPSLDPRVIYLLNKHFHTGSGTGTRAQLRLKLVIPDGIPISRSLISASSLGGGFSDASVNASRLALADGLDLKLGGGLTLNAGHILSAAPGGSAHVSAQYISLSQVPSGGARPGDSASLGGMLSLSAREIEISRDNYLRGFAQTLIEAQDIRFTGWAAPQLRALLDVEGELMLRAAQVYPATAITAVIRSTGAMTVATGGQAGAQPLSAGGTLLLQAPVIAQNGVLRAPFGQITLQAGERLSLGEGSITSVSGAGLVLPYGALANNGYWLSPLSAQNAAANDPSSGALAAPPEKRIVMQAPELLLATGSQVDISGGGDLHAAEFVQGPGGSHDVLAMPGMYAVLPGYAGSSQVGGVASGERIWLAGGPGLAAGWYALLPARYALLPGAFAVQATGRTWTGRAGQALAQQDGTLVMQGRQGNAHGGSQDQAASAWRVMPGATVRGYTEYNEAFANDFFSSEAFKLTQYRLTGQDVVTPRLARDGGAVVFEASRRLTLDGTLLSRPDADGRGGLVDIAGQKIAIVGASQDAGTLQQDGYLVIDAAGLSNFGAGSLLIGGKRQGDPLGLRLEVTAADIVVRNGAGTELFGPEIILAASDRVAIEAGSVVSARGDAPRGAGDLIVNPASPAVYIDPDGNPDDNRDGVINQLDAADDVLVQPAKDWGALVRVANGDAVKVRRQDVDTSRGGLVSIGADTVVSGGAALLIDATRSTGLAGSARISGADLSVSAGRIGLGGGTDGMVLDTQTLAQLADSQRLTLRSYSSFDFYRSLDLGAAGLKSLTFDGAVFADHGDAGVVLTGDTIALVNSGAAAPQGPAAPAGGGSLGFQANTLVLGAGQKRFEGFGAVVLSGSGQIVGEGSGSLHAGAAALTLKTPLLTGRGGAAQSLSTDGLLRVDAVAAGAGAPDAQRTGSESLGSRLALTGGGIVFGGRAVALGGRIELTATRGDVVLDKGASIDVGGFARQFFDLAEHADAGSISLTAVGGGVRLAEGSRLDLAAHPGGGRAGALDLTASGGGTVVLDGDIAAQAGSGGQSGAFTLDIDALPQFAGLSQRLNQAGFNRSRQFRIRQGDVTLDGMTRVDDFALVADQGRIDITGTVDARSDFGGAIRIAGGGGVTMQAGAQLLAGATGELGTGRVTLEAAGGLLDLQGGLIDVAGNEGGKVRLRALRTADHRDIRVSRLDAGISGARSAVVEGVGRYDVADYDGLTADSVKADALLHAGQFMAAAGAMKTRLGSALAFMPGVLVESAGDLALTGDWNLFRDFSAAREGTLTLRAGGNLRVAGHLSDGFDEAGRAGVLQQGPSWNLRLVAGADLASADTLALKPLAAQSLGGSIVIGTANAEAGAGKLVRTGTGDLEVRAGRDLTLAHKESVIYTAGRKDTAVWSDFSTANPAATYGIEGGNLDLQAQGGIEAQAAGQRFSEWLNRQGNVNADHYFGEYETGKRLPSPQNGMVMAPPEQSSWWINYGMFQQGVGAFGGGNVKVRAGADLGNLVVALTTHMRMRGGRSATEAMVMEMRNGGAMTVEAGGAIRGGQYYLARGAGDIRAAETTAGHTVAVMLYGKPVTYAIAPIIALGDASMALRTAGGLQLQTVIDPLLVRYGDGYTDDFNIRDYQAYMSGYTDRTALSLVATGGDIVLNNQAEYAFRDVTISSTTTPDHHLVGMGGNRYPARTHAVSMNGSLRLDGPLYTMPGAVSDLQLLAGRNITFARQLMGGDLPEIVMARGTLEMMPSPYLPAGRHFQVRMNDDLRNLISQGSPGGARNPAVLPLMDDREPARIYAAQGYIQNLQLTASEQTWVRAGSDLLGFRFDARNLHASDVTVLEAGRDIVNVGAPVYWQNNNVTVQGPGALLLAAGRDVFANDLRIQSLGNQAYDSTTNRPTPGSRINGLPDGGAAITVMAGLAGTVDYAAFAAAYLDPARVAAMPVYLKARAADGTDLPAYLTDQTELRNAAGTGKGAREKTTRRGLVSYMQDLTGESLAPLQAWARFQQLPPLAQQQFLRQVYMTELREAGRDQNMPGGNGLPRNGGYNRGYAAIDALFPGDAWKGDIAANNLMLRTMAGGDISVLAPGGGLQVAALGSAVAPGYGLVTLGSGHINIFANDDVVVNRSRILSFVSETTQRGSDQIIWSSIGDIDAGRGSKTVRVPSAPDVLTDRDANTVIKERSDMSGSGIGTVGDGDVDLVAPEGTINAGDAGIRFAGRLNLAALQVLNADNIQGEGEITGLPVTAAVNIGALTNASAAASQATAAAQDVVQRERAVARQSLPSIFTVRVLGFGNEPMESGEPAPAPGAQSSAGPTFPGGRVQYVGHGNTFNPEALARLTPAERRLLQQDR